VALTLLIGGARAGKSHLSARLAERAGLPVTFIATAEAGDDEMEARIARHRADRPPEWTTVEEPLHLARALDLADTEGTVIVDCLTLWVSNLQLSGLEDEAVQNRAEDAARRAANRKGPTIVVTNEVGSGVHPSSEMGRRFRDLLGRVNNIWADQADTAFLVVAGRVLPLQAAGEL
jgi:adenosylcobinamide kinase / adenosylcobinamide-phosphate guanylyltransferase